MTWRALAAASSKMGAPAIDYNRFAARWKNDPVLKSIVDRFDGHGLVIKTANSEQQPEQGAEKTSKISQMAMNAVSPELK